MRREHPLSEFIEDNLRQISFFERSGSVIKIDSSALRIKLPAASVGLRLEVERKGEAMSPLLAEVVGVEESCCIASPLGSVEGIQVGAKVSPVEKNGLLKLTPLLLGCALGSDGTIKKRFSQTSSEFLRVAPAIGKSIQSAPPNPLDRQAIKHILPTGIRAIDAFATLGRGQRLGIFAEPGVGKSTLLGSLVHSADCDVVVVALVGERGREVGEFLNDTLSEQGKQRAVVVYSTSEEPALARVQASLLAVSIAEYFRDADLNVLLLVDSLTRLCRAYREIGLLAGEPPVRKGYPASIFSRLPEFIERAGCGAVGSITALYTVLLSADFDEDPMVEEIKSLTDGHLLLRRELAEKGQYPAIDVVQSLSRLARQLVPSELAQTSTQARRLLSRLNQEKEMLMFGGVPDAELAKALRSEKELLDFLRQEQHEPSPFAETQRRLFEILSMEEQ